MAASSRASYWFGPFRLEPAEKILYREDKPVPLTPKAAETLVALVERQGSLVTKEELLRIVWPETFVEENNLAQNISLLRRVLGEISPGRPAIETVPKRGYRFVEKVEKRPHIEKAKRRGTVWALIAAVPLVVAVIAIAMTAARRPGSAAVSLGPTRLAVLPFVNLGAQDDGFFVAGMTEEITSRLGGLHSLAVLSGTTAAAYERHGKSIPQIGADLGVAYIVEGSVRWAKDAAGTAVRITPKLIRVADDTTAWTQQYDASLTDLFGVQADIAHRITDALQVALEARERRTVEARPTTDSEAYLDYLRGITMYQQGGSDTTSQAEARTRLESAVARDPRFALAWSWLARVYVNQYNSGALRQPEMKQRAERAARTAIEIDSGLPEGHLALAAIMSFAGNNDAALRELEAAGASLPNSPEVFRLIGLTQERRGHWAEALPVFMRGFDLAPSAIAEAIAVHYLHLREYRDASRFIAVAKDANRIGITVPEAWTRFSDGGNVDAARRVLEPALTRTPVDARVQGLLARLEWFDGRYQRALDLIGGMDASGSWLAADFRYPASLAAGDVYASMGRRADAARNYAAALTELERKRSNTPDDFQIEASLGLAAAGLGRAADAVRHGERAAELMPVSKNAILGPLYLYLLAGIHARLGQHDAAFAVLDQLFAVPGFYNESWVRRDPAFVSLTHHAAFQAHVERWSAQKGDALLRSGSP